MDDHHSASFMRKHKDPLRRQYTGRFTTEPKGTSLLILFDGHPFITIHETAPETFPAGFKRRVLRFVFDLLTGKRTALWDDQAVFGSQHSPSREAISLSKDSFNVDEKLDDEP